MPPGIPLNRLLLSAVKLGLQTDESTLPSGTQTLGWPLLSAAKLGLRQSDGPVDFIFPPATYTPPNAFESFLNS